MPPKVCVILPDLNPATSTHYWYWQQLFQKIQEDKYLNLRLIDETATPLLTRTIKILQARLQGYPHFYIHYSFSSLIISWLITRIFGGTTYFWHCEKYDIPSDKTEVACHPERLRCPSEESKDPIRPTPQSFPTHLKAFLWENLTFRLCLHLTDYLITGHQVVADSYTQVFGIPPTKIKIVPNYVTDIKVGPSVNQNQSGFDQKGSDLKQQKPTVGLPVKTPPFGREEMTSPLSTNQTHILFVHHLSPRKGSRELPEIITRTLSAIPHAHFHIVGSGPDRQWLKEKLSSCNLPPISYNLYGSLPLLQAISFFKSADYFILPSRTEGFPRVILEAMFYKIPFIATDVGCIKQIVPPPQQQFLTLPNNPPVFVNQLISLTHLKSKSKSQLLKSNYRQALKYNQKLAINSFIKLFNF